MSERLYWSASIATATVASLLFLLSCLLPSGWAAICGMLIGSVVTVLGRAFYDMRRNNLANGG